MSSDHPHERRLRTAAVHAGENPDPVTGASAPNLVMSTTFAVDEPRAFSALDRGDEEGFLYTRWGNPTVRQLEIKLAALEGAEDCRAYASGMAAISALLLSRLSSGDRIVVSDVLYPGTAELVGHTLPRMGVEVTRVDTSDLAAVEDALRRPASMVCGSRRLPIRSCVSPTSPPWPLWHTRQEPT